MNNVNFLKPNRKNLNLFLVLGIAFFVLSIFDFCLNNLYYSLLFFLYRYSFIVPIHKH